MHVVHKRRVIRAVGGT